MEEFQFAQQAELFLLINFVVLRAQLLMHPGQFGGEVQARLVALLRIFLQRHRRYVLELLGNLGPQRMNRRWGRKHDLVQQFLQIAGPEGPVSCQQLVHDGAQGIQVRTIGQFDRLNLLWRHVRRAAGNSLDPRNLGIGHQRNAEIDDPHVALEGEHDVGWV